MLKRLKKKRKQKFRKFYWYSSTKTEAVVDDNKFQKRKNTGKWSVNTDKITEKTLTVSEALEKGGEVYVEGYIFAQEDNVVTKMAR